MDPPAELHAERVTTDLRKYAYGVARRWFGDSSRDQIFSDLGKVFFAAHQSAGSRVSHGSYHLAAAKLYCARHGGDAETLAVQRLVETDGLPTADIARFLGLPKSRVEAAVQSLPERSGSSEQPASLTLERHIVGDLGGREAAELERALSEEPETRARHDRVFKERLLFLAETPVDSVAQEAVELTAMATSPAVSLRKIRVPSSVVASGAIAAVVAFLVAYSTGTPHEVSSPPVALPVATTLAPAAAQTESSETVATKVVHEAEPHDTTVTAPEPVPSSDAPDAEVSFWLYARGDAGVRRLSPGEEVAASEKIVPWVHVDREGFAAVLGLREDGRVRVYYPGSEPAERLVPGKTTRLGRAQSLGAGPDSREQFALLWSPTRFDVAPVAAAAGRGRKAIEMNFDGLVRWTDVRVRAEGVAAVQ